jgi:hypothetical protein
MKKVPRNYYNNWDNFERKFTEIINKKYLDKKTGVLIKDAGEFPTADQLLIIKEHAIRTAARKHDGFPAIRKKMGYDLKNKPIGFWQKWENIERIMNIEIESVYTDEKGRILKVKDQFPTDDQLPPTLSYAIQTYHDGLTEVKERMGYQARKKPGYWLIKPNFEREFEEAVNAEFIDPETGEVIKEAGEFPTQTQLKKIKKYDLERAITKHYNGFKSVRKRFHRKIKKRYAPINTFEDMQNFISEEKAAKEMIHFAGSNSHLSNAIEILSKKYPHRIKNASKFSRLVVESHVSLAQFVGPYSASHGERKDALGALYAEFGHMRGFDQLAFDIIRDENMADFNRNPIYVLARLESESGTQDNVYVSDLLKRVHEFYREIFELEVPGIPSLKENPRYIM